MILSLSGCQRVVYVDKEIYKRVPESLLIKPCEPVLGFSTTAELAINNRKNMGCILDHQAVINNIIDWNKQQQELYKSK